MKRVASFFIICMSLLSFCAVGSAKATPSMEGTWNVTGKVTVTGSLPKYASISVTFLNNNDISDTLIFDSGDLYTAKLGQIATYTTDKKTGTATIDISRLLEELELIILPKLPDGSTITFTSKSFVMKPTTAGKATGTLKLGMQIKSTVKAKPVTALISISATLSASKQTTALLAAHPAAGINTIQVISDFLAEKAIKPLLEPKGEKEWINLLEKVMIK